MKIKLPQAKVTGTADENGILPAELGIAVRSSSYQPSKVSTWQVGSAWQVETRLYDLPVHQFGMNLMYIKVFRPNYKGKSKPDEFRSKGYIRRFPQ